MWQRTKDVVLLVENAAPCYVILPLPRAIDGGGQRATSGWLLDQTNQNMILHIDIYLHKSKIFLLPFSIGLGANNLIFKISAHKCWNIICGLLGPWSLEKEEIPQKEEPWQISLFGQYSETDNQFLQVCNWAVSLLLSLSGIAHIIYVEMSD